MAASAAVSPVRADVYETYNLIYAYDGPAGGVDAASDPAVVSSSTPTATGVITLDLSAVANPGDNDQVTSPFVTDFSVTISNADDGNGTFTLADFTGANNASVFLYTNGGTLDFSQELIGQATIGDPYGTPSGNGGDFNFISNGSSPQQPRGEDYFTFASAAGANDGDYFLLTSFAPVPEPSSLASAGFGALCGLGFWLRRRSQPA